MSHPPLTSLSGNTWSEPSTWYGFFNACRGCSRVLALDGHQRFISVAAVLAADFVLEWPQSKERIRGADRFAQMNSEYIAYGRWRFSIVRLIGSESEAVSEVAITDGKQNAKAISFFTVAAGKITRLVEYWP